MVRREDSDANRQEQERLRLIEEAKKNPPPSINKADAYTRGIFGILSGNEAILTAAIKGSNQDFLEVSSKMSDAELAGDIAFFVAFSAAGRLGTKLGKNPKGGFKLSLPKVKSFAKSKGFKFNDNILPKVKAEIRRVNQLDDVQQQEGLLKIRTSKLQAARDLLRNTTNKTDKASLEYDIEGIKRSIEQGTNDLRDAGLRKQVAELNKLDNNIQFKVENGKIIKTKGIADPDVIKKNEAITDANIEQVKQLYKEAAEKEALAKQAREQAKAEDKAIDEDATFDEDEKGLPDEVIETKEKLKEEDKPNFDDEAEAKESDPLMEKEKSTEEMIDESIERNRQERDATSKVKTAIKTGGGAILTAELLNKLIDNDGDDNDPEFEQEPEVIPMDLMEEIEVEPVPEEAPGPAKTGAVSLPGVSKQEFRIIETTNVENNDRYFDQTLFWATEVYVDNFELTNMQDEPIIKVGNKNYVCLIKKDRNDLFVSFRGTIITNIHNIITDIMTEDGLMDAEWTYSLLSQNDRFNERAIPSNMKIRFHPGILAVMLRELYFDVIEQIKAFKGSVDHIILTGHSLGAGLAGIFYYLYEIDNKIKEDKIPIQRCITYASPRYVRNDPLYVDLYNRVCPNLTRIFNIDDLVSYLPFNEPVELAGITFLSGFKHVGIPRCLNGENKNNNINTYTVTKLQSQFSIELYNQLLKDDDIRNTERDIKELLYSKSFNSILIGSLVKSITLKQCSIINNAEILQYTLDLQTLIKEKFTYDEKIKELSILGIEDILKLNKVGEDPRQTTIGLSALFGMIFNTSMNGAYFHGTDYYRLLLDKAIQLEANNRKDIKQPIGIDSELNKNTEQKRMIQLRLNKQVNDLKEVQGIIYTDRDITEPVFISY